ncbi:MAG: nuclear transport factor 2 family protein [Deltaproteobacteria bacterium]|nr:nuclear transport factor 2 family protein [Deltaproteobacteria bacterium]
MRDREAITQRALDYVEGWYLADVERMDRALSPHLAKRRIGSEEEIWSVTKSEMLTLTGDGKGRIDDPEKGRKEITILDQTESMASVKIVSEQFTDYLHLAEVTDSWNIVNALWDYHRE